MTTQKDSFGAHGTFDTGNGQAEIYRINRLYEQGIGHVHKLPFSIKILLENALRHQDERVVTRQDVINLANWDPTKKQTDEIPFKPARVILQDFTGVPCLVDLAALRSAMVRMGGDPKKINPVIPVDLVIDHSVQVDAFGTDGALRINAEYEFGRNKERYEFIHWGQKAFKNFSAVPPATGIIHQVNLEYLAKVVQLRDGVAYPDTLVGTDSHTTMINGLGVLGWGVGGIEAEAAMLGQPIYMLMPEVIGVKLTGSLPEGATATDLVLTTTEILRKQGVVDKFVEFFGVGCGNLSLPDRATIANMAPEYGATIGFFPVDTETLSYMYRTGRTSEEIEVVERYCKEQGLFRTDETPDPIFTEVVEIDLSTVVPSMAGPQRPQDRIQLSEMKSAFQKALRAPTAQQGYDLDEEAIKRTAVIKDNGNSTEIGHGSVIIAAITSCTNTSNPSVMVGAGLVAKKAVEKGLKRKPHVKSSMAPGSRVVTAYLDKAGLTPYLDELGFNTVGYGCTTCIGNSGPLPEPVANAVNEGDLVAAAVLSGNRNFTGRIHQNVKANYLASPPLVVAYSLVGTVDIDFEKEPVGYDEDGNPVMLADIWPTQEEILETIQTALTPDLYQQQYGNVYTGNDMWNAIKGTGEEVYDWDETSTYVQEPPFFVDLPLDPQPIQPFSGARALAMFGDSITTDHISPAGAIAVNSPAGQYLLAQGVERKDFNSYGTRRGNDRVMTRGTFANIRLRNLLVPDSEGNVTYHLPTGEKMSIYDAAMQYQADGTPLVIFAGKDYGMGSSRDWAAKGTFLMGVKAVIAASFERIHRSNLVMMGVLPLQFPQGLTWQGLGLTGHETFEIIGLDDNLTPKQTLSMKAVNQEGKETVFDVIVRIDTPVEVEYYRNGGILQTVLRNFFKEQ